MTPWEGWGIRSDHGALVRCVGTDRLRIERWSQRTREWVADGSAVWDFDFLPLATLSDMRAANLYTAAEWRVLEAAADAKGWLFALTKAARILGDLDQ